MVAILVLVALVAVPGNGTVADEPCIIVEEDGRVYVSPPDCAPDEQSSSEPTSDGS